MALKLNEPYEKHINPNQCMWEQPPGSGQMYSGEGDDLGVWVQAPDGSWSLPVPAAIDIAPSDEEAYLNQQANAADETPQE